MLLVRFFQVLCLLHVIGYSQLNAHPGLESLNTPPAVHVEDSQLDPSLLLTKEPLKVNPFSDYKRNAELVSETFDEKSQEFEQVSCKKDLENSNSFISFYVQLPEYLHHNTKSSLAFCKQLSFIPVNNRQIIFQIFRI